MKAHPLLDKAYAFICRQAERGEIVNYSMLQQHLRVGHATTLGIAARLALQKRIEIKTESKRGRGNYGRQLLVPIGVKAPKRPRLLCEKAGAPPLHPDVEKVVNYVRRRDVVVRTVDGLFLLNFRVELGLEALVARANQRRAAAGEPAFEVRV